MADQRTAVIQAISHRSELPRLLDFLRAACRDPLQTEAWICFETVYTTTVDRRQRAVTLQQAFAERVGSATQTADPCRFPFDARDAARLSPRVKARRSLLYEERDVRSSMEVLVRRRVLTPAPVAAAVDEEEGEDDAMSQFLLFQGCAKRSELARRGVRCPLHEGVCVSVFAVQKPPGEVDPAGIPPTARCPFPEEGEGKDVLVEIEAPIRESGGGGLLKAIDAAKEAAAVLQDFIVVRKRK